MEIYVHFIYNVVQIKEHIDQYFQLPVLYQIWTEQISFFFKFTSHTCTSVCAEPRVFVKSNSLWDWIVISACIFVKRWILGLQNSNVHAYIETDNRIHLVRGWGVVCKPKQFRLYILRCMENSIKIIVNWITFTSTLAIHLWLSIFLHLLFVYSEHFIPI